VELSSTPTLEEEQLREGVAMVTGYIWWLPTAVSFSGAGDGGDAVDTDIG
jgi:hypothetical protein